uniref:Protein RBC-1 n=1 Tax=Haemonchus contortus TaxID=6289 RepID=W6NAQ0_HAECO
MKKLSFTSEKVCRQRVSLPEGVHLVSAAPVAGHLSSSFLYPACQTPYLVLTSCDDDKVRFWRCTELKQGSEYKYEWVEWNMISVSGSSDLKMEGTLLSISAAHCGRIACAYNAKRVYRGNKNVSCVELGVFECESSGGVEWLREATLAFKSLRFDENWSLPQISGTLSSASRSEFQANIRHDVHLDWVSTEDGSHILTASVGTSIYMFTQISLDPAQRNVTLMKESDSTLRRPSLQKTSSLLAFSGIHSRLVQWVCSRVLELRSADGLPPLPTALGWVREGLLIVGMLSEMRVYNQWNIHRMSDNDNAVHCEKYPQFVDLVISQSHGMLNKLHGRKERIANKEKNFLDSINKFVL